MKFSKVLSAFALCLAVLTASSVSANGTIECSDCDGKLNSMILRWDGNSGAFIEIDARQGNRFAPLFAGTLGIGQQFVISATDNYLDRKGTLGANIYIRVDGQELGSLHTSCSQEIGPGTTIGDIVVIAATSRNGGFTCPVAEIPDPPCDPRDPGCSAS